jgi:hypothetical protein
MKSKLELLKPSRAKRGKKMQIIERLLRRKRGCTAAEVRAALGWPTVSIPQRAKQLGIKTRKEIRYWSIQ